MLEVAGVLCAATAIVSGTYLREIENQSQLKMTITAMNHHMIMHILDEQVLIFAEGQLLNVLPSKGVEFVDTLWGL